MNKTSQFLNHLGLASKDLYELEDSRKRFSDNAQFRFEVPGIQGPKSMNALLDELPKYNIYIHRVTQTKGIMTLTDEEILEMVALSNKFQVELVLSIGPRATYDTSATVLTKEGQRMGLRLRGQDQIIRAVEDINRAIKLGCKSFLLYDEGLMWLVDKMRNENLLSENIKFKISAHCGHGNPCSAKLLETIGANSINPVRDIQLQMLSAIRQSIDIPLDIHTENPSSSGGFIRHYEVPDIIRIASPVYLKTGGSIAKSHSWNTTEEEARQRAKQVALVNRVINEYYSDAIISERGSIY